MMRRPLDRLAAERHGDPVRALAEVDRLVAAVSDDVDAIGRLRWIRALLLHELVRWDEAVEEYGRRRGRGRWSTTWPMWRRGPGATWPCC